MYIKFHRPQSVRPSIRRPSVHIFNPPFLRNHLPDLNQTLSEVSVRRGNELIKKITWWSYSPCCHGNRAPNLKKSSSPNPVDGFQNFFHRNVLLSTVYQVCINNDDISKNMAARGRSLFSIYGIYRKTPSNDFFSETTGRKVTKIGMYVP